LFGDDEAIGRSMGRTYYYNVLLGDFDSHCAEIDKMYSFIYARRYRRGNPFTRKSAYGREE
jgi:hypothetical protein